MMEDHQLFCGRCDKELALRQLDRQITTFACPGDCGTEVFVREVDWMDCPVKECNENYRVKHLPAHFIQYHPGRVKFEEETSEAD